MDRVSLGQLEAFHLQFKEAEVTSLLGLYVNVYDHQRFIFSEVGRANTHIFRLSVPPGFNLRRVRSRPIGEVLNRRKLAVNSARKNLEPTGGQEKREF